MRSCIYTTITLRHTVKCLRQTLPLGCLPNPSQLCSFCNCLKVFVVHVHVPVSYGEIYEFICLSALVVFDWLNWVDTIPTIWCNYQLCSLFPVFLCFMCGSLNTAVFRVIITLKVMTIKKLYKNICSFPLSTNAAVL